MLARLPALIPGTSLMGGSQHAADNEDDERDERDKRDEEHGKQDEEQAEQDEEQAEQDEEQAEQEGRDQHMPPRTKMHACEMHAGKMNACEMPTRCTPVRCMSRLCLRDEVLEEKWQVIDHCNVVPAMQFNNGLTPSSYTCLNHFVKLLQRECASSLV
jgi:hypothetical protein